MAAPARDNIHNGLFKEKLISFLLLVLLVSTKKKTSETQSKELSIASLQKKKEKLCCDFAGPYVI